MQLVDRDGKQVKATITTERAASSYGMPVVVVGGEALGTAVL